MKNIKLSQRELQKQREQLQLFKRLLPSLDLKRRQLTIEVQSAKQECDRLKHLMASNRQTVTEQLPMLGYEGMSLDGLLKIANVSIGTEYIAGVVLPKYSKVEFAPVNYSALATPVWLDTLIERLKQACLLNIQLNIAEQRLQKLSQLLHTVTQRVNLFDRVLIPNAHTTIKRISLFLADLERDAAARSKLAKQKRSQLFQSQSI